MCLEDVDILTKFHFLSSIFDFYSGILNHSVLSTLRTILDSFPIKTSHVYPAERSTIQLCFPKPAYTELAYNAQLIEWYSNVDTFFIEVLEEHKFELDV